MIATKTILVGGLLTAAAFQAPTLLNSIPNDHFVSSWSITRQIRDLYPVGMRTTFHKNGQIKEDVLLDDGNFMIIRTFDEHGNQVFHKDSGLECVDLKQNSKGG